MWEFLSRPAAQVVVWMAALLVLLAISFYVLRSFRGSFDEDDQGPEELLDNFREMHMEGDISEREFRQVKQVIEQQAQQCAEVVESVEEDPDGHDDCDHPGDDPEHAEGDCE